MAGCLQDGHRCSSRRWWTGQANMAGSRQVLRQAPPYWSWTWLPSPARHCGQYRVAAVNTHGLATGRMPCRPTVITGSACGYRLDMLLTHKLATSAGVSLDASAKAAAAAW